MSIIISPESITERFVQYFGGRRYERVTYLDFGLQRRIFRGVRPDSVDYIEDLKAVKVTHIVSFLAGDWKDEDKIRGKDQRKTSLKESYEDHGFIVINFPIHDREIPNKEELKLLIDQILEIAASKENTILMHCSGGLGRTGLVAACIAQRVLGLSGEDAINWIRKKVPMSIESREQENFVRNFDYKKEESTPNNS